MSKVKYTKSTLYEGMPFSTVERMEALLALTKDFKASNPHDQYLYVETGRWKPWKISTVNAIIRRGYHVDSHCHGTVFYVWPKGVTKAMAEQRQAEWQAAFDKAQAEKRGN